MFKGFGDLAGLIKNAQNIQQKMEEIKKSLSETKLEASAGGGLVTIEGCGDGAVLSVKIDDSIMITGDKALLEDLVLSALNSFNQKTNDLRKEKLIEATGGMLPGAGLDFGL